MPGKTMRAAIVEATGQPLKIVDDAPVPTPGPDQILVRVTASSLCMSDIAGWAGHLGAPLPFVAGHEPAGVIEELGASVKGFNVGDRVGFMPASRVCGACSECIKGEHRFCTKRTNVGFDGPYGGFSTYCLADPLSTAKIPDGLSDEAAAPLLCAGVTAYGALKKVAKVQTSGTLLNIIGCGGVGHLVIMYAKAMGYRVHAFDVADDKLKLATDSGADKVFNSMSVKPEDVEQTSATIVVSGAAPAYKFGFKVTKMLGTVIAVGVPEQDMPISLLDLIMRNVSLVTTNQGTKQELIEALQLAADYKIKPVSEMRELSQLNEGYQDMCTGKVTGRLVYKMS